MKVKVKVKKRIKMRLTEDELSYTSKYLNVLKREQDKLPAGASDDLKHICTLFGMAYDAVESANGSFTNEQYTTVLEME